MTGSIKKILVFAAHPDDEVLGCGGIIQHFVKEGSNVVVCILTDGWTTQYSDNPILGNKKKSESVFANKLLGVDKVIQLDFPDMKLDQVSHAEINKKLQQIIDEVKPEIIFTQSNSDLNLDHQQLYLSTMVATRPGNKYLKKVYTYEVGSSSEWNPQEAFIPNVFFDISSFIDKKIESFQEYKSEIRDFPHPRSAEGIRVLAKLRGMQSGYKFAESFKLIRSYGEI